MRTKLIILTVLLLLSQSCREIHVKTVINNNGQIQRSYTLIRDVHENGAKVAVQNSLNEEQLPNLFFPVDTSWKVETHIDTIKNKKISTYSKVFENKDALQHYYDTNQYTLKKLNPRLTLNREFKWLKTINSYSESMDQIFRGKDNLNFFTKTEIINIENGNMNDTLQKKYERWVAYHITDEIAYTVQKFSSEEIELVDWKKIMYERIKMSDNNNPLEENNPFDFPELKEKQKELDLSDFDLLIETIEKYSGNTLSDTIKQQIQTSLEEKMEIYMGLYTDELFYTVQIPGKIVNSNADSVKGNTAYWKLSPFIAGTPFRMEVVSEQSNAGVAVTLGAILIIIIFIWLIRRKG